MTGSDDSLPDESQPEDGLPEDGPGEHFVYREPSQEERDVWEYLDDNPSVCARLYCDQTDYEQRIARLRPLMDSILEAPRGFRLILASWPLWKRHLRWWLEGLIGEIEFLDDLTEEVGIDHLFVDWGTVPPDVEMVEHLAGLLARCPEWYGRPRVISIAGIEDEIGPLNNGRALPLLPSLATLEAGADRLADAVPVPVIIWLEGWAETEMALRTPRLWSLRQPGSGLATVEPAFARTVRRFAAEVAEQPAQSVIAAYHGGAHEYGAVLLTERLLEIGLEHRVVDLRHLPMDVDPLEALDDCLALPGIAGRPCGAVSILGIDSHLGAIGGAPRRAPTDFPGKLDQSLDALLARAGVPLILWLPWLARLTLPSLLPRVAAAIGTTVTFPAPDKEAPPSLAALFKEELDRIPKTLRHAPPRQYDAYHEALLETLLAVDTTRPGDPRPDVLRRLWAVSELSGIRHAQRAWEDCFRLIQEAGALADAVGDAGWIRSAKLKLADYLSARGRDESALRILETEILPRDIAAGNERATAVTRSRIAGLLAERGALDEAQRMLESQVIPVLARVGSDSELSNAYDALANIRDTRGDVAGALALQQEQILPRQERIGHPVSIALTNFVISHLLYRLGRNAESYRLRIDRILPVFRAHGDAFMTACTLGSIADNLNVDGHTDQALDMLENQVVPALDRIGATVSLASTWHRIAGIRGDKGEAATAIRILRERVIALQEARGKPGDSVGAKTDLVLLLKDSADPGARAEAIRLLEDEILPVQAELGWAWALACNQIELAVLLARRGRPGDRKRAVALARQACRSMEQIDPVHAKAWADWVRNAGLDGFDRA